MSPPKLTPKSKRNEKSRRSSILKPRKPRQPFQNVNFDSPKRPSNEISSTPLKTKRRVSFAEKKHVKEFCHSVEQGTVWDNTYEEHDFSLKSYVGDSNGKTELIEDAALHISKNECEHISESDLNHPNNFNLTNNQLIESVVNVQEKDNDNLEMTFANSIKCIEFDKGSQCEQTTLSNKSVLFPASRNATSYNVFACSNTDENYIETVDEKSRFEQNMMPSALSVSHVAENAISNIIIYRDFDKENNIGMKSYFEPSFNNVASELDKTCNQDLSMEFTAPIPVILPSCAAGQINIQKDDITNYIGNCNNVSIQASQINSDLGIFKQIAEMQNRGNASLNVENNTHDKMMFSRNLQSNVVSENTDFKQIEDATQNIAESMMLTNVINVQRDDDTSYIRNCNNVSTQTSSVKPVNSDLGIFKQIAEMQNRGNANLNVENNAHDKPIFSTNLQSNVTSENAVFKQTEDVTQNIAESMMLTNEINVQRDDDTSYIRNCNNVSTQTSSVKPVNSDSGIFKQIAEMQNHGNANLNVENTDFKQTEDVTQNIAESMMLTNVINLQRDGNMSNISNCNNVFIQVSSVKSVNSDLGIFKQIAEMQNRGNASLNVENNAHDKMIFSINLPSNVASENTDFKQIEDATQNIAESMMLTNVINLQRDGDTSNISNCNNVSTQGSSVKLVNSDLGIFKQIAEIQNRGNASLNVENNTHDKTIFSRNLQSNVTSENADYKQSENATQNIAESMMLTNVINVQSDNNTSYIGNCNNVSTQAASMKPVNSDLGIFKQIAEMQNPENANFTKDKTIFSTNLQSNNVASENAIFKQTEDATQNIAESMILTTVQPCAANTDMGRTNTVFNTSMEMTAAISSKMYDKIISHSHKDVIEKSSLRKDQTDETEFFTDIMMEMTKPINVLPLIDYDKARDLKMHDEILNDDKTMSFQDISMEMTNVLLKNQEEVTRPIVHKSTFEENGCKEKNMNNSTGFDEKTKLCKSMEFIEAVPVPSHHERTFNAICTAQSTSISQTTSRLDLPVENSVSESTLRLDTVPDRTIQHVSMEITAIDLSSHLQNADERESLNNSKDNESQHLTTNNLTINNPTVNNLSELRKSVTEENYIISREISAIPSSTNNVAHSLNAVLKNCSSRRETFEDEQPDLKKFCSSFMESRVCQENNISISLAIRPNDNDYVNDCNEYSVKDTMDDSNELSRSNFGDNLEISERNLFRKSLQNNIIELNSINPPSFSSLDSDKEENSSLGVLYRDQLLTDNDGTVNNMHNNSNQLIANNVMEHLAHPNEECAPWNDDYLLISRKTVDYMQVHKSNRRQTTNIEDLNEESVSSKQTVKHGETNTDYCTPSYPLVIEENKIIDDESIRKRINNDAEPQNNIKDKEQYLYLDAQRLEVEQCTDHRKRTEVVGNQSNSEEHCKENLNEAREMEQREECGEEKFAVEQCVSMIEDESLTEQDTFLSLLQKLETHSKRDDCIWNVYHKDIDKKKIVFGFISNSLILVATFPSSHLNSSRENLIEKIRIVSRVADTSGVLIRIVHKLILEKLDEEMLMYLYKTHEDVLSMLEHVSQDVKLAMDFMFDLKRLDALNLMEIAYNKISFTCRSKKMDIILKVTINVKRFDKLTLNDINVNCLLGRIKETDVKSLIKNIKKDHKFLRRYMNDIKDYIDIMEGTLIAKRSPIDLQ